MRNSCQIVVQRDNAPPVSVFGLSFLVPNRAFFVASGEWVYATYDSVAPGQFAAAAAITFGIGNFDSFIQRLVWFDAGTGRVDYDGHASTTVFLPCNATCLGRRRESNKEKKRKRERDGNLRRDSCECANEVKTQRVLVKTTDIHERIYASAKGGGERVIFLTKNL